jgi:hypothetical protein
VTHKSHISLSISAVGQRWVFMLLLLSIPRQRQKLTAAIYHNASLHTAENHVWFCSYLQSFLFWVPKFAIWAFLDLGQNGWNFKVTLHFVPFHFVPGHFVPVTLSTGYFVPGHFIPGHFVPWSLCPPVTLSPGHFVPSHFVPRSFCPPVTLSPVTLSPISDFWNDMISRSIYFKAISERLRLV